MKPISTRECNQTMIGRGGVQNLPCRKLDGFIVSCWKLSVKERLKLLFTGRLWLLVMGGSQPPVCLEVDKPQELEEEEKS